MSNSLRQFLKNAAANLSSGAGSALLAVVLPPFLARWLSPDKYGAWLLLLQLAAYISLLRFGLESVMGRSVAVALTRQRPEDRDRAASNGVALLGLGALVGGAIIAIIAWQIGPLFPRFPAGMRHDASLALCVVGGMMALGLPLGAVRGVFGGYQRYEIPGMITLGGRGLAAAAVLVAARIPNVSLTELALAWAAATAVQYTATLVCWHKFIPDLRLKPALVSWRGIRELWQDCLPLSLWNIAMLMISGLDVALVGRFDFVHVAYYAVASNLVALISGICYAIFTSLIPTGAALSVRADGPSALEQLLLRASRWNSLLLLATGLPLLLLTFPLLQVWIGTSYARLCAPLLQLLVFGNLIRLVGVPYALLLVGTGQQGRVILTPILEGVVNLAVSVWLGSRIGASGVAWGTVAGAVLGTTCHLGYNMPRTVGIRYSFRRFAQQALARPLLACVPVLVAAGWAAWGRPLQGVAGWVALIVVVTAGLGMAWRCSLDEDERQRLRSSRLRFKASPHAC